MFDAAYAKSEEDERSLPDQGMDCSEQAAAFAVRASPHGGYTFWAWSSWLAAHRGAPAEVRGYAPTEPAVRRAAAAAARSMCSGAVIEVAPPRG